MKTPNSFATCLGTCVGTCVATAIATAVACQAAAAPAGPPVHWVAAWGTAQLIAEKDNALAPEQLTDTTLRQIVRLSLGGPQLRVRISNVLGTEPLQVDGATVAQAVADGRPDLVSGTLRPLRFGGSAAVTVPAGAEYFSDPVDLPVKAGTDLAVSLHFTTAPVRQTGHPGSRTNSFLVKGSQGDAMQWPEAQAIPRWYQLADVDVAAPAQARSVVAIGDSITDGYGVALGTNTRWTDFLVRRLADQRVPDLAVVNAGIGGGRLLRDGLGPNMASRFERDVLGRSGASHAIVMIGVNDLGGQAHGNTPTAGGRARLIDDMKEAHRQLVARAHAQGVCVIGATITPYAASQYYQPDAGNERERLDLNHWIRTSGTFDGVADFDAALRDPAQPDRLLKAYDNDGLHPSAEGYRAMAQAVPLGAVKECSYAVRRK
ncbi:lysophospholipase L1-like esterase [Pseudoduganella lurida]|uniref:Lysophospholipase L1-like esterase n=1 Tax=Pseudoduganella lurida TaxID=1036180 RepID=A0A562RED5_9BURK|nr:SGNH/GDSL hydrolase family protein [Pseudoduganella lurida]TWI67425.1 lysophospholipase L1-like esterase [Pseudoduganella lurida]